ncbi:DUF6266 family protein [Pedobacter sp. SAFR-022]|uniref:DUF6266 family protein n=1 Tax=Pedobacter sp. SAFR-022 TaxID=3436861 RepID=UPI003F823653
MAKYTDGVTGAFSGKVGTVIGSSWNGIPYMKSKGNPRTTSATGAEQANRSKFAAAHAWLHPLLPLLRVGFNNFSKTSYGYNAAKSYLLKHSMEEGRVIPERVKISAGDLMLSADLNVHLNADDNLHFSWSPDYLAGSDGKDQLMALAYSPENKTVSYMVHGAFRELGVQELHLAPDFRNTTIHVYAAFIAADRTRQSDSLYFGPITVS